MGRVERGAHAAVVQHNVTSLHAFPVSASLQVLIEAFKFKAALAVAEDVPSHPLAAVGAGLLCSHGCVVQHVVDGAKEWWDLSEEMVVII